MLPPKKIFQKNYSSSKITNKSYSLQNNIKLRIRIQYKIFNIFKKYNCVTSMNYFSIIYKVNLLENILYKKYNSYYISFLDVERLESKILKIIKDIIFYKKTNFFIV